MFTQEDNLQFDNLQLLQLQSISESQIDKKIVFCNFQLDETILELIQQLKLFVEFEVSKLGPHNSIGRFVLIQHPEMWTSMFE